VHTVIHCPTPIFTVITSRFEVVGIMKLGIYFNENTIYVETLQSLTHLRCKCCLKVVPQSIF